MTKVEAPTLEEAYREASLLLECSISELQCEVVQYPSKGILGLMKKNAIVVAVRKSNPLIKSEAQNDVSTSLTNTVEEDIANKIIETVKADISHEKNISITNDEIIENFFDKDIDKSSDDERLLSENEEVIVYDELAQHIESELKELLAYTCFDIDIVEVDVIDNKALIFLDGEDAALLIGKEGYRYNALSYMLFNWLHTKYELFIKLEIAEFLTKQHEMIQAYIRPVVDEVKKKGRSKTKFLDGILVQIALEQLRDHFPDKYVAVKTTKDDKKFVVINEFNTKSNG